MFSKESIAKSAFQSILPCIKRKTRSYCKYFEWLSDFGDFNCGFTMF